MSPALNLFFGLLIVGFILTCFILFLIFWIKSRKIKKNAPNFEGDYQNWKGINHDDNYNERRSLTNGRNQRRVEGIEGEAGKFGKTESEQEEIRRIREQIARAERELAESRGN